MPSPFAGMDPFLENPAYWSDFHSRFINAWCEAIADELPPSYEATLGERVYLVEHDPEARKLGYPDVAVTDADRPSSDRVQSAAATLQPVTVPLTILEGPREAYIEILHQPDRSLVAGLELLSPANKEEPGRTEYLAKRRGLIYRHVHLVELDLLFGGRRVQTALPPADYYLLSHADERPDCRVYSWSWRQPLPKLPVPLLPPDADIVIDLGKVFCTAYDRGRFARRIDYKGPLPAKIGKEDRAWIEGLLASK